AFGYVYTRLSADSNVTTTSALARISPTGGQLGPDTVLPPGAYSRPVWNGYEYGLAWDAAYTYPARDIFFTRVAEDGSLVGSPLALTTSPQARSVPSLVWNGGEYAIAWADARDGKSELYFARFRPDGTRRPDIRVSTGTGEVGEIRLVATGSGYIVVWSD